MSISNVKEYKRYFGDFRGVDFASDETQVSEKRFARAVNVYKDYQTSNGHGIETIPGFRRRVEAPNGGRVYGIHTIDQRVEGNNVRKTLIHAGTELYLWENFGEETEHLDSVFPGMNERDSTSFVFNNRLYIIDGKNYIYFDGENVYDVKENSYVPTTYINIIPGGENADIGAEYEQRNMLSPCFKHTFIITEYKNASGTNVIPQIFYMNEPFDEIVSVKLYDKELAVDKDYSVSKKSNSIKLKNEPTLPENTPMLDENGDEIEDNDGNTVNYPEMYAGLEVTAKRAIYQAKDVRVQRGDGTIVTYTAYKDDDAYTLDDSGKLYSIVEKATVAAVFDNRIFFSGIPGKPNLILYCGRNDTGYSDPSYIGVLNYMEDGVGDAPVTAMVPIANALLALKANTEHEGAVYYHTPSETGFDIIPKVYPSESGLAGTGCLGAAINFLDDPVFVSSLGLEAIGQLSVRYERAREHRSSLVDAVLVNNKYLREAKLCEWCGYLLVLVGGSIFMADSRQRHQAVNGDLEYEWYYLEDIGVYEGQTEKYSFLSDYPKEFKIDGERIPITVTYDNVDYVVGVASDINVSDDPESERVDIEDQEQILTQEVTVGDTTYTVDIAICATSKGNTVALLCETFGEMHGGDFRRPTAIASFSTKNVANVYFGTENGVVCSFNFDKRTTDDGLIDPQWYTFDNRRILSGISLAMDNCGFPDMLKTTVKKSLVVKARSMTNVAAKINVRTNRERNSYVGDIAASFGFRGFFANVDFQDFSFLINDMPMFSLNEKQKKWAEKQYSIFSDQFQRPFSLVYLMYRYRLAGKFKG